MKPKSKKYKAMQLNEHNMFEIRDFINDYRHPCDNYELILNNGASFCKRPKIRKDLVVKEGDWVVKTSDNRLQIYSKAVFPILLIMLMKIFLFLILN